MAYFFSRQLEQRYGAVLDIFQRRDSADHDSVVLPMLSDMEQNKVHSENCYLIFGISDDCRVVGMKQSRYELANIIDALSKLEFATIDVPKSHWTRLY